MKNNYKCLNSNIGSRIIRRIPSRYDTSKISLKKRRLCLKCGKNFLSNGPYNRLCENCVSTNAKIALKTFYVNPKYLAESDY